MSNSTLFKSAAVKSMKPPSNAVNLAGGKAYSLAAKEALAQYASCGTFNGTFYATPQAQFEEVKRLLNEVEPEFIAKLAIYSRERAWLKDMPSFLIAHLAATDVSFAKKAFSRSIDDGKMIRNFAQMIRSGMLGRKSFGSAMKKAIESWLDSSTDAYIFNASIGNNPSLADVIKMVHPRPATASRAALYGYLIGKEYKSDDLPDVVKQFELFKKDPVNEEIPSVDFRFLTSQSLSKEVWVRILKNSSWQMARQNINTFARHGVFDSRELVFEFANKLSDKELVRRSKVFPYQLLAAYINMNDDSTLEPIRQALHDAMETAVENVPSFGDTSIGIGLDVSLSMKYSITGIQKSESGKPIPPSKVRCIDVAAMLASVVKRNGINVSVYKFNTSCTNVSIDGRDTIITNTQKLADLRGGTDCSSFIRKLNEEKVSKDVLFIISDNMSWVDFYGRLKGEETSLQKEWNIFKRNNPKAKLILLDIVPNSTTQGIHKDILNIAGWNDRMFIVISDFISGKADSSAFIKEIESIKL